MKPPFIPPPSVVVSLLFAKRSERGFVRPLLISRTLENPLENWPDQIVRAFENAGRSGSGQQGRVIDLLPCLNKQEETSMKYCRGGVAVYDDEGVYTEDERTGESHVLMILLGLYALGADLELGQNVFRQKLASWTASAKPTPNGELTKVGHLDLKLIELHRVRHSWRTGTEEHPPISQILLAESNRSEIESLTIRPTSDAFRQIVAKVESNDDRLLLFDNESADSPWLVVQFAKTFDEAVRTVFSDQRVNLLISALRMASYVRRVRNAIVLVVIAAFIGFSVKAWSNLKTAAVQIHGPEELKPTANVDQSPDLHDYTIEGLDSEGDVVWTRQFSARILKYGELKTSARNKRFWVSLFNKGPDSGWLYVLNDKGDILFRFHPGKRAPYEPRGTRDFNLQFAPVMSADVLPEPGVEIVASAHCDWYPSKVCIVSEDGRLLKTIWHQGSVSDPIVHVPGTSHLVFYGPNNGIRFGEAFESQWPPLEGASPYYQTVHALNIAELPVESETEPFILEQIENAVPAFHYIIIPRSLGVSAPKIIEQAPDSTNSSPLIEIVVGKDDLRYQLNIEGTVISKQPGSGSVENQRRGILKVFKFQADYE